jgi:hypothetical protein
MTRLFLFSFFILQLLAFNLSAADNYPVGARSAGVADASVTYSDVWSAFNNQAGVADLKSVAAGTYYENKFLLPDLGLASFVLALPVNKTGVFALSATQFGNTLYSEQKAGLAFAKQLGEKVSAGVQLDYLSTHIATGSDGYIYGSTSAFTVEGGIIAEPIEGLKIGLHIFNPSRSQLAEYDDERVPTIMKFGASYKFSEKVLLSSEVEKDVDQNNIFKTGVEYHVVEQVYLRAGIASNPSLSSFGFGFKMNQLQIDVAASYHQVLGFSQQISLVYDFKHK